MKRARAAFVVGCLMLGCLAAAGCAPDESSIGAVSRIDGGASPEGGRDARARWRDWWRLRRLEDLQDLVELPLSAVTGVAVGSGGVVVGGVSSEPDLFWDAWLIPSGDGSPRRLAPIGDRLVAVDAAGALWTGIVSEDERGRPAFEVRLSPSDGAASVLLSPGLPATFSAELSVADGGGGRLLIGSEDRDGAPRLSIFAVDARGRARRLPGPPVPPSPIVLDAALAAGALRIAVQFAADGPPTIVTVPVTDSEVTGREVTDSEAR